MNYSQEVQALIDNPLSGRSEDDVRALFGTDLVLAALAHEPPDFMIQRFVSAHGYTDSAARSLFDETKKFLVANRVLGVKMAPSEPVDQMWHSWILFTKDYYAFCEALGGYIHHLPIPVGSPDQPPLDPTIEVMRAAYGSVDEALWPLELGAFGGRDCKAGA